MNQTPYKRRRYFLLNTSQPRLLMGLEFIFLFLLVISGIFFYMFASRDLTAAYFQAHLRIKNTMNLLLPVLVGINMFGLILGAVFLLFYTHRIAGPAHRLNLILRDAAQGKLAGKVKFRESDELKELEKAGNEMLVGLNQRLNAVKDAGINIRQGITKFSKTHPDLTDLEEIQKQAEYLHQLLNEFELGVDKNETKTVAPV